MNNEPVAWTDGKGNYFDKNSFFPVDDLIPLYTHPTKTLTDEEIEEVYRTVEQDFALTESKKPNGGWRNFPVELARAILRKAQQ